MTRSPRSVTTCECFHSLQAGRHFRTHRKWLVEAIHGTVSIPFHREGISERDASERHCSQRREFPFPSTGTAFPNYTEEQKTAIAELGFHSLQPGRHFRTWFKTLGYWPPISFPFPSTGKAFPNVSKAFVMVRDQAFPFPSTGKAFPNSNLAGSLAIPFRSFHSLQPGRHFRTG